VHPLHSLHQEIQEIRELTDDAAELSLAPIGRVAKIMIHQRLTKSLAVVFLGVLLLTGCQTNLVPQDPVALAADDPRAGDAMYVQWLGVSSWIISRGSDGVVVDPFFSRPGFLSVMVSLVFRGLAGNFVYNSERIADVLPDLPKNTKFVLLGHAHYDHLMDVPYYVEREPGKNVAYVGSDTTRNILLGFRPNQLNFVVVQDGKPVEQGRVRITAFTSDHAPHVLGLRLMTGAIAKPLGSPPTHAGQYVEGTTLIYFIDFLDEYNRVSWRVFVNGAASSPEGAKALHRHQSFLREHPTNVAILCVPGWNKVDDYPNSILRLVDPDHVVLSHYDDFASIYKNGEDPRDGMRFVLFANYEGFVEELRNLKSQFGYRYRIHAPKTGQCIRFAASDRPLPCER
jgi:glyoxylase-like metal-dependent hydrolase (beta-lactamase superfamily II)